MPDVIVDRSGGVMRLQLNRAEKKNAITVAMYEAMGDALSEADRDATVRAVLLCGAGDAFTAGNDLRDFLERPPQGADHPVWRFASALTQAQKPIVAAVQGLAIGIGTTMLFHCDLVYAAERTRFSLPFVDLGLVPELGSSLMLPALAGYQKAAELLLLGRPFDEQTAASIGLVAEVVPGDRLEQTAMGAARALAEKPAAAVRMTKALLKRGFAQALSATLEVEGAQFVARLRSPEAREAFSAFLEKRKPDFSTFD
jgi:enoyl-CoA hydratase/carnithine racemase